MNKYDKIHYVRRLKYSISLIIISLLILACFIGKKNYPEFKYHLTKTAKVSLLKGECYLFKDLSYTLSKKRTTFNMNRMENVKYSDAVKLKVDDIIDLSKKDGLFLKKACRLKLKFDDNEEKNYKSELGYIIDFKEFNIPQEKQYMNYQKNKKNHITGINYAIVGLILIFFWLFYTYFKKYFLHITFIAALGGYVISSMLIGLSIDILNLSFLKFNISTFFIMNMALFIFSFFLFDNNYLIPELFALQSDATDLIIQGHLLFKNKKYKEALIKFQEAVQIDPEQKDIHDLIKILEIRIKKLK